MEYVAIVMRHDKPSSIAPHPLPPPFSLRRFRRGDEEWWARIEAAAAEFDDEASARAHFASEFGELEAELSNRCLFLLDPAGRPIGTAAAWWSDEFHGLAHPGRIHWVAIIPEFQGRGLSKPLVAEACRILASRHRTAYLTTQTTSWIAVKVYLDLGFEPWITDDSQRRGWRLLYEHLGHPALAAFAGA